MRSRDKKLKWLTIAKTLADMGAGLGAGGPGGAWGQNLQGSISNLASSIEQEKAEEEAKKKNSGFGSLGGLLGGIVGNAILPGVGGAIGGALGSAGGQAAGGGDVNFGQVVSSGLGGYMGGGGLGKSGTDAVTAGTQAASNATKQATTQAAAKSASDLTQSTFGSITAPVGTGTVLSPAASPPPQNVILGNMQKMGTPSPLSPIRPSFSGSSPLAPATAPPIVAPSQMPEKPGFWQRAGDAALPTLYANSLISSYMGGGGGYPGQTPLGQFSTMPARTRNVYSEENDAWIKW